jgi:molybdopterin-guanine dinucleotide biosynthesis protein MobB
MTHSSIPILGFAGWSGAGKTTLIKQLIPALIQKKIQLSIIKHAHHSFDVDYPGKDSYLFRKAGAHQTLLASHHRWVLMDEHLHDQEPDLFELIERLDKSLINLILVEGFRDVSFPKIEVYRPALGKALLCENDEHIFALLTDQPITLKRHIPILDLNDLNTTCQFIADWVESSLISNRENSK